MEASQLRQLSGDELKAKVNQWKDELFRMGLKAKSEMKDTSQFRKLRRQISRGLTLMNEKKEKK